MEHNKAMAILSDAYDTEEANFFPGGNPNNELSPTLVSEYLTNQHNVLQELADEYAYDWVCRMEGPEYDPT